VLAVAALAVFLSASAVDAQATTIFSDDFETGIVGWTTGGTPDWYGGGPSNGSFCVRLRRTESIQQTISTVSYENIAVSFYMGASSLEGAETVRALWFDGATWTVLATIANGDPEEDGLLHYYAFALPVGAADNPDFALRFEANGNNPGDYGFVDDVVVAGDLIYYTLDLTGVGNGSVTVDWTSYALPWSGSFAWGTVVTLEAVPAAGWQFDNWSGGLAGSTNPDTITMDSDKAVTANFSQIMQTLDLTGVGSGSVTVDGTPRALPWSGSFAWGSVVTLEAVPVAGWQFANWSGDLAGSTNPDTVTMNADKSVTANFAQIIHTLDVSGIGNGSITVDGTPQSLPWSGSFAWGTVVTLEAVPAAGWQFDNWSGDLTGSTNPDTITTDSDKSVTANFSQIMHTLDLTGVGSGSVTVDGTPRALPWSGSFAWGTVVTLEAVPVPGWLFTSWSGDLAGSTNPDTITTDSDKAVTANFSQIFHTLDLTGAGSGSVTVDGTPRALPWSGSFAWGTVVTLEAVPAPGWQFDNWSGDSSPTSPRSCIPWT
jgi:uncharacterized repeat protein (TIGR02543 family)